MPKYSDCAHAATQELENGSTAFLSCRNSSNMLLLLFLGQCKDKLQKETGDGPKPRILEAVEKTCRNVRDHQSRIYKLEHLEALKGTGDVVVGMVKQNLWSEYAPEPASEEELALEAKQKAAVLVEKAREKERKKKMRAEAKAEAAEAAARGESGGGAGPDPLRGGLYDDENGRPCASPGDGDDELGGQPKKKKARTAKGRKEYVPNKGDANWAVMLMLLKHCRDGKTFMTKQELCQKAESSGLLKPNVSMYPQATATARPGQMQVNYCGWSAFKTLVNREPPLCLAYSAPKKIKLTNEGEALAVRLYKDAAAAGYINWRIPDIQLDAEGMSQPAPSPAIPQARPAAQQAPSRPPSQAFRSSQASCASHSQHMQPSSSGGRLHAKGRALEPQSPTNSPSWDPPSTSQTIPGVSRLQSDLLMHPSSSIMGYPEEEELSLSQCLSQSQPLSQALSQSASQPLHHRQAAAIHPMAAQQVKRKRNEEAVMMVMEAADCSYEKAQEALADGCSVNRAVEKLFSNSEEDDDSAEFGPGAFPSQMADPGVPMGASQSNPLSQTVTASGSQHDLGLSQKRPSRSAPVPSIPTHPASLISSTSQALMLNQPQSLSHENPSTSRQPSGTLGGTLGRAGSAGVAKSSRPVASGQGRASGCSQGSQGAGHIEAAHMESSGTSWKVPCIGAVGSIEEQGIRIPPLSPGCRFSDEYELVLVIDSREQYSNKEKNRIDSLERHVQLVRDRNIAVEVRCLQQGDVLWIAKPRRYGGVEYVLDYIMERKRVDDLHQSIKERRYDRQKYNMQSCGLRHLMYLVEGDPNAQQEETAQKAVKTATVHTEVIDGFQIVRTAHCTATMQSLAEWTNALKRKYDHLTEWSPQVQKGGEPLPTFDAFRARSAQMRNRTVQDVWGLMLTSVPGWSGAMVEAVVKQYGTPLLLYRAYMQAMQIATRQGRDAVEAARQLLVFCQLSSNRRPISVNNSAKVFDLLFANGWHCV